MSKLRWNLPRGWSPDPARVIDVGDWGGFGRTYPVADQSERRKPSKPETPRERRIREEKAQTYWAKAQDKAARRTQSILQSFSGYEEERRQRKVDQAHKQAWQKLPRAERQRLQRAVLTAAGFTVLPHRQKEYGKTLKAAVAMGLLMPDGRPNPNFKASNQKQKK